MNSQSSDPVSLVDIARVAQVSTTTASQALRGVGRVSPETRNRVQKVAQKLRYRPNLAASLLARQSQNHNIPAIPIALIGMGVKPFTSAPFVTSFTKYATQIGFQVIEPELALSSDLSKLLRVLYHRGVRGIILNHSFDASQITDEDAARFSFLFFGNSMSDHRFHRVSIEIFHSTSWLWEMAWERGYRRIAGAPCRHPQPIRDDFARESAILACEQKYNAPRIPHFIGGHYDFAGFAQWIREVKPDAVVSFGSGVIYQLRDAGFHIPEDFGLCSLHCRESADEVTGFYQNFDEISRVAAHQMEAMICRNETGFPAQPHSVLIDPIFKEGQTLPVKAPRVRRVVSAERVER